MTFVDTLGTVEYFVEALARVDRIGPTRRLIFTVTQPDGSGGVESVAAVCPSSDNLRLIRHFEKGGSGSSGVRV
jgi:hypothetical protein